jgi:hypothetical protein
MKRFKLSLLGLLAITGVVILFYSCDKVNIPVNVPVTSSGLAFDIPSTSTLDTTVDIPYSVNIDSIISHNSSLSISNITAIKIDSIIIEAPGAAQDNSLFNIHDASVTFESDINTTPTSIATFGPQTDGTPNIKSSLTIPVNNTINLDDFVAHTDIRTNFVFHMHCGLNQAIHTLLHCTATVHYKVQASL